MEEFDVDGADANDESDDIEVRYGTKWEGGYKVNVGCRLTGSKKCGRGMYEYNGRT